MNTVKFLNDYKLNFDCSWLVVAIELPSGQIEIITNQRSAIHEKMQYYLSAYDDNLVLNTNSKIKIVSYMFA